jgi:thiol:disulfide interchange protein DsbD
MGEGLAAALETAPLLALGLAFLGGLATSFTPCVYPIIPITVTSIGARGVQTRLQAFVLSLFYALGIAVTYTGLGIFAVLSGFLYFELDWEWFWTAPEPGTGAVVFYCGFVDGNGDLKAFHDDVAVLKQKADPR